jgi:hypothetical protein
MHEKNENLQSLRAIELLDEHDNIPVIISSVTAAPPIIGRRSSTHTRRPNFAKYAA